MYSAKADFRFGEWVFEEPAPTRMSFYREGGELREEWILNREDEILGTYIYIYEDNLLVRRNEFNADQVLAYQTIYLYQDGALVEERTTTQETGEVRRVLISTNSAGHVVLREQLGDDNKPLSTTSFTYEGDALIEQRYEHSTMVMISKYDHSSGLLVWLGAYTTSGAEMFTTQYDYEFNEHGDWIVRLSQTYATELGVRRSPYMFSEWGFQRPEALYREIEYR